MRRREGEGEMVGRVGGAIPPLAHATHPALASSDTVKFAARSAAPENPTAFNSAALMPDLARVAASKPASLSCCRLKPIERSSDTVNASESSSCVALPPRPVWAVLADVRDDPVGSAVSSLSVKPALGGGVGEGGTLDQGAPWSSVKRHAPFSRLRACRQR